MQCSRCDNEAIIELKYAGLGLCRDCFIEFFERRVAKTIGEYRYLEGVSRKMLKRQSNHIINSIAVALSGGKDSSAVLYLLNKMLGKRRDMKLVAISIDGGIKGYDDMLLKNAKRICKDLDVELHGFSFKKEFDYTLDDLAKAKPGVCNCGIFRRQLLNKKARELGADRLATGHNLDDEVESIVMNMIRGDVDRIVRGDGIVKDEKFVPRIKPLQRSPESEVELYAKLIFPSLDFGYQCPYKKRVLRYNIKKMIDELEAEHSGIKFQIFEGNKRIREYLMKSMKKPGKPKTCKSCGEITTVDVCQVCKLKEEVHKLLKRDDIDCCF